MKDENSYTIEILDVHRSAVVAYFLFYWTDIDRSIDLMFYGHFIGSNGNLLQIP